MLGVREQRMYEKAGRQVLVYIGESLSKLEMGKALYMYKYTSPRAYSKYYSHFPAFPSTHKIRAKNVEEK
jgi:hypothetical protein